MKRELLLVAMIIFFDTVGALAFMGLDFVTGHYVVDRIELIAKTEIGEQLWLTTLREGFIESRRVGPTDYVVAAPGFSMRLMRRCGGISGRTY
jgi:hypothetical protein